VQLTASGKAFWESLQERIYQFYQQALRGFSFDDSVALLHFLNKLHLDLAKVSLGRRSPDQPED